MNIRILEETNPDIVQQLDRLLHVLDSSLGRTDGERLKDLIDNDRIWLFIAEDSDGRIGGMLTLTCCPTLSRNKYWIEDVVVDEDYRGRGTGRALVKAAVSYLTEKEKSPALYLTSNPSRVSARNLYRSEGFEEYDTGVFRLIR